MSPSRAPAPTAPALVNVLERCGASVTRSGKVSESVDKHLGRKALVVDGDVPAAHFVHVNCAALSWNWPGGQTGHALLSGSDAAAAESR